MAIVHGHRPWPSARLKGQGVNIQSVHFKLKSIESVVSFGGDFASQHSSIRLETLASPLTSPWTGIELGPALLGQSVERQPQLVHSQHVFHVPLGQHRGPDQAVHVPSKLPETGENLVGRILLCIGHSKCSTNCSMSILKMLSQANCLTRVEVLTSPWMSLFHPSLIVCCSM